MSPIEARLSENLKMSQDYGICILDHRDSIPDHGGYISDHDGFIPVHGSYN